MSADPAYTYYVDFSAGSDANPGTIALPWKTLSKVGATTLTAGQSVGLHRGQIWRESLIIKSSGTSAQPITLGAYGTGSMPIISGADALAGWQNIGGTTYSTLAVAQPKRLWDGNTELTYTPGAKNSLGTNGFDWGFGVLYVNIGRNPEGEPIEGTSRNWPLDLRGNYVIVNGLHVTKANDANVASADVSNSHVTIENCLIDYAAGSGGIRIGLLTLTINSWTIKENTISNNGLRPNLDHGIYLENSSGNLISDNIFDNNAAYGVQMQDSSNNNLITRNSFSNNRSGAVVIWDDSGSNMPSGNSIAFNTSNGDHVGVQIGGSRTPSYSNIYNNTFYGFSAAGLKVYNSPYIGTVTNNIFYSPRANAYVLDDEGGAATMTSDYNVLGPQSATLAYWHRKKYGTLAAYKQATQQDFHSLSSNPMFIDATTGNLSLEPGSPAAGTGIYLAGDSAIQAPNIGAN